MKKQVKVQNSAYKVDFVVFKRKFGKIFQKFCAFNFFQRLDEVIIGEKVSDTFVEIIASQRDERRDTVV